jgi:hypothetical protein
MPEYVVDFDDALDGRKFASLIQVVKINMLQYDRLANIITPAGGLP